MKFGSSSHGLGDYLLLSAILKYSPNQFTIQLPPEKQRFSILFKDLAKIEITNKIQTLPDLGHCGEHYATRKLKNFFGDDAVLLDNRPLVLYSDIESEKWAAEYLKDKPNPAIFVPTCSPQWKNVRNIPEQIAKNVYKQVESNYTPIVCQSSSNFLNIGEHQLTDLDLKKYVCLLRKVGLYFGANTGDYHLMTAVGGRTFVYQPVDHSLFISSEWDYNHPNNIYYTWRVS